MVASRIHRYVVKIMDEAIWPWFSQLPLVVDILQDGTIVGHF